MDKKTLQRVKEYIGFKNQLENERDVKLQVDQLKTNIIHNTDNIKGIRQLIPNNSIDLTVTSPPYDNLRDYDDYDFNFKNLAQELYRVTKEGGVVVWIVNDATVGGSETGTSFKQALYFKEIGFNLHDTMVYQKINPIPTALQRYQSCFEYMFIFSKQKPKTINLITEKCKTAGHARLTGQRGKNGTTVNSNSSKKTRKTKPKHNIWKYKIGNNQTTSDKIAFKHPAIFPEKLVRDHIKSWSNEGDVVLDPFMGSGTTAKMAKKLNRNYVGFEVSEKYCEIAKERINNL